MWAVAENGTIISICELPVGVWQPTIAAHTYGVSASADTIYSRAYVPYHEFRDRPLLLTVKLLNQRILLTNMKSSLRKFYGRHRDLYFIYLYFLPLFCQPFICLMLQITPLVSLIFFFTFTECIFHRWPRLCFVYCSHHYPVLHSPRSWPYNRILHIAM